jgi:hypothetical protein
MQNDSPSTDDIMKRELMMYALSHCGLPPNVVDGMAISAFHEAWDAGYRTPWKLAEQVRLKLQIGSR